MDKFAGQESYYFLDGYSGYNQITIHPKNQEKTIFAYPYKIFAFRRVPLGYVMYLEYSMMFIFSEMIENGMEIILDDFSVLGSIYDQCLETLDRVLKRCESYNLVLN